MKEMGRLITDPYGTEKPVFAPRPELTTPTDHVVVFPDKKEHHVDWRANFAHINEMYKAVEAAEIVQEEGIYRVPMSHPDVPYVMGVAFSDSHIGSLSSDHQLIQDTLETTLTTPNTFLVDLGDTFDNGIWGGLSFEQAMPPYMQTFTIQDIIREFGEKYGACVIGNHPEWMFNNTGQKPEFQFAQQMKGPVFAGMGLLHVEAGNQQYDWAIAHNYWGKSKKNIFNVCVNLRQTEYPNADIFGIGHEHIWGYAKERCDGKERLYFRPGTAKIRDRYARIHGIAKRGQECGMGIILGTQDRSMEAYPLDDAVSIMNLRCKLAGYDVPKAQK